MNRLVTSLVAFVILGSSAAVLAQPAPGGGGGRGGQGRGMRMPGPNMFGPGALDDTVMILADLNLRPGFSLSEEQKAKIQTVRDAFKAAQEKWRADNESELKEIQDNMNALREQGPDADPEAWRDLMEQNQSLQQSAPRGDEEAEQIRAVLTPEQTEALKAREEEIAAERQKMWEQMGGGRGPGGGQGGPGGRGGRQGRPGGQGGGPGGGGQGQGRGPGI